MDTSTPLLLKNMRCENDRPAAEVLMQWFARLQAQRGVRAELRQAQSSADIMLSEGFRLLAQPFRGWLARCDNDTDNEWRWIGLALAAGACAHVKQSGGSASFAAQLGHRGSGSERPVLSELRFNRLLRAHDHDEFYRLVVRAVRQCEQVNVPSLVDGILLWCREQDDLTHDYNRTRSPFQQPALRWATEYFQATESTPTEE